MAIPETAKNAPAISFQFNLSRNIKTEGIKIKTGTVAINVEAIPTVVY